MPTPAENRARYRLEALTGVSGGHPRCVCCGEKRVWALVFDHIHGGGTAHRRESAFNPTVRLVRREYRQSGSWPRHRYQVLCAVCNHGRRINSGLCPHQTEGVIMSPAIREAVKSYVKVFASSLLSLFLADGADVFGVSAADARTWIAAALGSVLPLVITALDPNDSRFGIKIEKK